jgi:hypothetical protein
MTYIISVSLYYTVYFSEINITPSTLSCTFLMLYIDSHIIYNLLVSLNRACFCFSHHVIGKAFRFFLPIILLIGMYKHFIYNALVIILGLCLLFCYVISMSCIILLIIILHHSLLYYVRQIFSGVTPTKFCNRHVQTP